MFYKIFNINENKIYYNNDNNLKKYNSNLIYYNNVIRSNKIRY